MPEPSEPGGNNFGRPTNFRPEFCEKVIEPGKEGNSPVQIACGPGVPRTTMLSWAVAYAEFSTALLMAKQFKQAYWEQSGFVFDNLVSSIQHCGFLLMVRFAPPSKRSTIISFKRCAALLPACREGGGVRSHRD